VEGTFVKDLRILGRDLSRVVIVDNAVEAFSYQVRPFKPFTSNHYQINNGVPIKSWFAENDDCELLKLLGVSRRGNTWISPVVFEFSAASA
jgi:CTD small phosphatase-like protein 2